MFYKQGEHHRYKQPTYRNYADLISFALPANSSKQQRKATANLFPLSFPRLLQLINRVDQYKPTSLPPKSSELQLYTWKNATMGEIASLVQQAIPDLLLETPGAAETGGELHFRHIFLDMTRGL